MKNWIRFIGFLAVFLITFILLNLAQASRASSRWENFYLLPSNSVDILFMGNSHNYVSFNPVIINDILNTRSYVVGMPAESIIISYYELNEILKYQKPQAIILESTVLNMARNRTVEKGWLYEFLDTTRLSWNKAALAFKMLFPDQWIGIFPVFRSPMQWEKPYQYIAQLQMRFEQPTATNLPSASGADIIPDISPKEEYLIARQSVEPYPYPMDEEYRSYFNQFIDMCQQQGITLFLSSAPYVNIANNNTFFDTSTYITELNTDRAPNQIDFNQQHFNQLHFYNRGHVNTFGSVITSTETAVALAKELGMSIDQKALDYYRTFYFKRFDITTNGRQNTITLYPADPNAPLEYSWQVVNKNITLVKTEYQSSPSFTFEIFGSSNSDIIIKVKIRNTAGNFILPGEFSLATKE